MIHFQNRRLCSLLIILFITITAFAQKIETDEGWTDDHVFYYSEFLNDSIVQFSGQHLHEGGFGFTLKLNKDTSMTVTGGLSDFYPNPSYGAVYNTVEIKTINGIKLLIFKDQNGQVNGLLREVFPHENLESAVIKNIINFDLCGTYKDSKTGKEITFFPDAKKIKGLGNPGNYEFEYEYDYPTTVITFSKGNSFYYTITETGLDLFRAINDNDQWVEREKLMSLTKTGWFNLSGNPALKGKYSFASTLVLTDGILNSFSKEQLKIMRNEIFARHGYIFKSEAMKQYFEKQPWYQPVKEEVADQLTELEKLNIQLLQRFEEIKYKRTLSKKN